MRASWLKPVADPPHRLEVTGPGGLWLKLRAQSAHVHGDGRSVGVERVLPDRVLQLVAREDLARMARKEQQQEKIAKRLERKRRGPNDPSDEEEEPNPLDEFDRSVSPDMVEARSSE